MGDTFKPDETYVKYVLEPSFSRHQKRYFRAMLWIHYAHILMMYRQGMMERAHAHLLLAALDSLDINHLTSSPYDCRFEDLYFVLEDAVERAVGEDATGNMHVAFSRNDMDATMFRLVLREDLLRVINTLVDLRAGIVEQARTHVHTVMLAHTHNQQAQPTTLGHYLMGVEQQLSRDTERLKSALTRVNLSPMGACALGGTAFPIDRHYVKELLCFDDLVLNTYDAVSTADYVAELVAVAQVMLTNLSRFVHDLVFWTSNEVNAITLDARFVQTSSIMPQKRNPVALEHVRSLLGRAMGRAQGIYTAFHNVPYGDINDTADNIQPDVEAILNTTQGCMELLGKMLSTMTVNTELLENRASTSLATTTELADTLVREQNCPFRQAHGVVSTFADLVHKRGGPPIESYSLFLEACNKRAPNLRLLGLNQFVDALNPRSFVAKRTVIGGPAPSQVLVQVELAEKQQQATRDHVQALSESWAKAHARTLTWKLELEERGGL